MMYLKKLLIFTVFIVFFSCSKNGSTVKNKLSVGQNIEKELSSVNDIVDHNPIKNSLFKKRFVRKAYEFLSKNKVVSFDVLQGQKLENIEENSGVVVSSDTPPRMNGNQMYFYLKERTLVVGKVFMSQFGQDVTITASAYVIHEDGIILTNYHVIEVVKNMDSKAILVSDKEGVVYPVTDILSSSQANDLAILKIDTGGKKLKALPFAPEELVGEPIYMMGHPFANYFYMGNGIIARKYISERDDAVKIAITAEFGQGASGGPVVNENGQLVGMVSATKMNYINNSTELGIQFILKEVVPVSVISDYVKRNPPTEKFR